MSGSEPESELLAQIESGEASGQVLEFAARGLVPLPPGELVRAIATILSRTESTLVPLAEESFKELPPEALKEAVLSPGVKAAQLDAIARRTVEALVLEPLIRHKAVANDTLAWLAARIEPYLQDVLVTNQVRLLEAPAIVERLFENPHLSADIRRRADEFLEEFFLKKEREAGTLDAGPEESETAPAPAGLTPAEEAAAADDEAHKSLFARLATMTITEKIRLAWRGSKEERLFLIRDPNRLVATAVLKSPKTREADAETIANMKSVSEDVLRAIAFRKEWLRKYSILAALVRNPRSPIDSTLPLVLRLNHTDQKKLAMDRNVPEALRASARREVARRDM
ncbi:MAG TPA: hypothetical protein VLH41_06210 [Thermoanaerobaculia bacterium]|nr:hypothetical protein [Thermoanaerobaculia bacterium]